MGFMIEDWLISLKLVSTGGKSTDFFWKINFVVRAMPTFARFCNFS
jgi:hypothetical protein